MKCAVCKNGEIVNMVIDYQTKVDGNYILVKNVPVEECNVCGEQFVSYETALKIEEIIKDSSKPVGYIEIPVYDMVG